MATVQLPTKEGLAAAQNRLAPYVPVTPLFRSELLSKIFEATVYIKNETQNPIASFKIRGALNAVLAAKERGEVKTVVTSSTGNHGQGVSYAARLLGIPAHVFLPEQANPTKKLMIQTLGATIHQTGKDLDEAKETAIKFAKEHGFLFVDDGEDAPVMEGTATVGMEILNQIPCHFDYVFCPMGSGALAGGVGSAMRMYCTQQPAPKVIAVQPEASPAMTYSFREHKAIEYPIQTTRADGTVCRVPAQLALEAIWSNVDEAWLVPESELVPAMRTMIQYAHVLAEGAGAIGLAGAWRNRDRLKDKVIVLIVTGANATASDIEAIGTATPYGLSTLQNMMQPPH